jgi:BMFP domain-containing protein YqiC
VSNRRQVLDDVAKLATSAAGLMQGASREIETLIRQRLEQLLDRMDLVNRDEFDAVKAMAAAARAENEDLRQRVEALEAAIQSQKMPEKTAKSTRRTSTKTRSATKKRPTKAQPSTAGRTKKASKTAKK